MAQQEAPAIQSANRRYWWRLGGAIAVYGVVLTGVIMAINASAVSGPALYAVALLPMVPVLGVPAAMRAWLRDTDEMQRRIALESMAIAFAAGSVLTFGYGFLQLAGAPDINWFMVWPVYAACWLVAQLANQRRYRVEE